jgi:hypothetical protein
MIDKVSGRAIYTDAQAADLQAGRWYFNVHTAAHRDGELREEVSRRIIRHTSSKGEFT